MAIDDIDDNDRKKDSCTAAGAAPTQTRPDQALDRCCVVLDSSIMKYFSSSIDLDGSRVDKWRSKLLYKQNTENIDFI